MTAYWCNEKPKPPPINAKCETVAKLPMFGALPVTPISKWQVLASDAEL
jgi:hypothetical protein